MQARIKHPVVLFPDALQALQELGEVVEKSGLPPRTVQLVHLRASQVNGCSTCVYGGVLILHKAGESDERIATVAAWRDTIYFSDAERAALALTEAVTNLDGHAEPVSDELWNEAARHYDESQLAALVLAVANINVWNRLNIATKQIAGAWTP